MKNKEFIRTLKYAAVAASAGVIQIVSTLALNNTILKGDDNYHYCYLIGLVLSVIWNFTINRKFTFKAANNIPIAMLKVAVYYIIFTPLSTWWTKELIAAGFWGGLAAKSLFDTSVPDLIVQAFTMIVNFVTEFLYQRFFVFGKAIDTNASAKKDEKEAE